MTIEDFFELGNRRLFVVPSLQLPDGFIPFSDQITIVFEGTEESFDAQFTIQNLSLVGGGHKSCLALIIIACKGDIPVGGKVFVDDGVFEKIY